MDQYPDAPNNSADQADTVYITIEVGRYTIRCCRSLQGATPCPHKVKRLRHLFRREAKGMRISLVEVHRGVLWLAEPLACDPSAGTVSSTCQCGTDIVSERNTNAETCFTRVGGLRMNRRLMGECGAPIWRRLHSTPIRAASSCSPERIPQPPSRAGSLTTAPTNRKASTAILPRRVLQKWPHSPKGVLSMLDRALQTGRRLPIRSNSDRVRPIALTFNFQKHRVLPLLSQLRSSRSWQHFIRPCSLQDSRLRLLSAAWVVPSR